MTNAFWKRVRGGTPASRVFAVYMALVLIVAMVGPGLAVYAAEGDDAALVPVAEVPLVEPIVEPAVVDELIVEPAVVDQLIVEPVAEVVVAEASVEAPITVLSAIGIATAPVVDETDSSWICAGGVKLDSNPRTGTYTWGTSNTEETLTTPSDYSITITTYSTASGMKMDFTSNYPVSYVKVKGGTDGNFYTYDPPVYSATGLHAPVVSSGMYADISHIVFCFGTIVVPETGDLEVYKYLDANENGEFDDGEEMLEGWTFTLYDSEDTEIDSGVTDANGKLVFTGLTPGDYYVTETLEAGWDNTTPLTQNVTVLADGTAELWFGNIALVIPPETGDLEVYKYLDANENSEFDDGEEMLQGWTFTLYDSEDTMIDSGVTDANGKIVFSGLTPGDYYVTETLEAGWDNTTPLTQNVTVLADGTVALWFGNIELEQPPVTGDLEVYKYLDANENSEFDAGEDMLQGWTFTLYDSEDTMIESGVTDANGKLVFTGLTPGDYYVTETLEAGWDNTTPLTQNVTVLADGTVELWFGNIELSLPFTELDLAITKLADKATASEGELITYTLTYRNLGDLAAQNFTIVDDFDERYVSVVTSAGGVVVGGKIIWTIPGPLTAADGPKTIIYTVRVIANMPTGTTNVDNVVVITHPRDTNPANNTANERVIVRVVDEPFLPFTEDEPFLPFTGGEYLLLIAFAVAASAIGLLLKPRTDTTA